MRTIVYITTVIVFLFSLNSRGQTYQFNLDEIYLGIAQEEVNDFELINSEISNSEKFKFRKAIRIAKMEQNTLNFNSSQRIFALTEVDYLRLVRRTANQSNDSVEFISKLSVELPSLKDIIESDASYADLYNTVRPATFYGRIEALPDVL
ncbi:hypothetical protein BBFL7_01058 [Flavobacteria bacterium BBFL7]|nr:hypothetical protein BBFL7_01058 [Flavobacteria bacterium BBFL7]